MFQLLSFRGINLVFDYTYRRTEIRKIRETTEIKQN